MSNNRNHIGADLAIQTEMYLFAVCTFEYVGTYFE